MGNRGPDHCNVIAFTASDGRELYVTHWKSCHRPVASLIFVHGIRSHAEWYRSSSHYFASQGLDVHFMDRRGSGLNTVDRGDTPSFRRLIDDIAEYVIHLRRSDSSLPNILGGISWGGKVAASLPYRHPGIVDGILLIAPGLKPAIAPSMATRLRIFFASRLNPCKCFPIPLNEPELFTASNDWQAYIEQDRYGLRHATARFLYNSFALDVYLRRAIRGLTLPVLTMLAEQDRIIDNTRTRKVISRLPATDNHVISYVDSHHTLEFEPDDHPWKADIRDWVHRRWGRIQLDQKSPESRFDHQGRNNPPSM